MHTDSKNNGQPLARLILWLRGEVLPLWANSGFDTDTGVVYEGLLAGGEPDLTSPRRAQNQAKFIYVLAKAECAGWGSGAFQGAITQVTREVSRRFTSASRADGYFHSLNSDLSVLQDRRDTQDHAFFILSSIASYSAYGNGGELRRAYNILDWLKLWFADPEGAWKESSDSGREYQASTLAAMTEVFLTLHEMSRKPHWLEQASQCIKFLLQYYCGASQKVVFTSVNGARRASKANVKLEDLLQWAWLLYRYEACGGQLGGGVGDALYHTAIEACWSADTLELPRKADHESGVKFFTDSEITLCCRLIKATLMRAMTREDGGILPAMQAAERLLTQHRKASLPGYFEASPGRGASVDELFELCQATLQVRACVGKVV